MGAMIHYLSIYFRFALQAWKKIETAKHRSEEILQLREQNEKRVVERISAAERQASSDTMVFILCHIPKKFFDAWITTRDYRSRCLTSHRILRVSLRSIHETLKVFDADYARVDLTITQLSRGVP